MWRTQSADSDAVPAPLIHWDAVPSPLLHSDILPAPLLDLDTMPSPLIHSDAMPAPLEVDRSTESLALGEVGAQSLEYVIEFRMVGTATGCRCGV